MDKDDERRITSIADTKNYDLSLYPIPRASSIPEELNEITQEPIFHIDELTLDAVKARIDRNTDAGDMESRMAASFGVLYGDVLIRLDSKGLSAEDIFEMLQEIKK